MPQDAPVRASLFVTCLVDQLYPQVGQAVVNVLGRQGVELDFPPQQTCCGQPLFNSGFRAEATRLAERTLDCLAESDYVVVPSGSCAAMIKVFYPELFEERPEMARRARELAAKTYEFSQFLVQVLGVSDVGAARPGVVTYHPSCHLLRELEVVEEPVALLRAVDGLEYVPLPDAATCCGFGGTFSVKYPGISEAMLKDKVDNIVKSGAAAVVACDAGCLMQIRGGLERRGVDIRAEHLAQALDGEG